MKADEHATLLATMTEAEARAEAARLNRESASGGQWMAKSADGAWSVVRLIVAGLAGRDTARVATVAPPPTKPDPSQDVPRDPPPLRGF